ncbi:YgiT-type zinc finger protein [Desulfobacterales bacterium HSG2]|nr:YgiT-type zinc finger protein [Desulfobacterales bacterium HSG2]
MKKCPIHSCPGQYQKRAIIHAVRYQGKVTVLNNVPAEVCTVCGDTLISLDVAEAIESILRNPGQPSYTAPVYEMPEMPEAAQYEHV